MRTYERHQLKENAFITRTSETISWALRNRSLASAVFVVIIVIAVAFLGGRWYLSERNQAANQQLGKAMQTYTAPIRPANAPAEPGQVSFTSSVEQAKTARGEFQKIADQYNWTNAGKIARYMTALCALNMGDAKAAEEGLKGVTESGDADLASIAKLALAGIYSDTGRTNDARQIYQDMIEHPTNLVSKPAAQIKLAALYQSTNQVAEANKLFAEIVKDDPRGAAASIANQRMSGK